MKLQDGQGQVCDTALDAAGCGEAFNRDVLDVDSTLPSDRKILLVDGGNG